MSETGSYRWHDKEQYYTKELGPKLDKLQILLQQYKAACQYDDTLKQYGEVLEQHKEVDKNNKRLRRMLEACHRLRTVDDDPPIALGNGNYRVTIAENPDW
jgi:hypothetical protein